MYPTFFNEDSTPESDIQHISSLTTHREGDRVTVDLNCRNARVYHQACRILAQKITKLDFSYSSFKEVYNIVIYANVAETAKLYRVIDRLHQAGLLGPSEAFNPIMRDDDLRDEEALAAQDWTQRQFI